TVSDLQRAIRSHQTVDDAVRTCDEATARSVIDEVKHAFGIDTKSRWWWRPRKVPHRFFKYPAADGYLHGLEHIPSRSFTTRPFRLTPVISLSGGTDRPGADRRAWSRPAPRSGRYCFDSSRSWRSARREERSRR